MSTHRIPDMADARRQKLLETAAAEFAAHGYNGASLNRILRACGMSKSSFYHFASSKADLFDAVIQHGGRALAHDLDLPDPDAFDEGGFWDHIGRLGHRLAELSAQKPWYVDMGKLIYLPDAPVEESPALKQFTSVIDHWLEDIIDTGQRVGAIRDDLPRSLLIALTKGIAQALDEWSVTHLNELDRDTLATTAQLQVEMFQRLLAPDAEGPRTR